MNLKKTEGKNPHNLKRQRAGRNVGAAGTTKSQRKEPAIGIDNDDRMTWINRQSDHKS